MSATTIRVRPRRARGTAWACWPGCSCAVLPAHRVDGPDVVPLGVGRGDQPAVLRAALTLDGYRDFFGTGGGASPWPAPLNSTVASVVSTLCVLLLAFPAAYALSIRPVKKWTDVLFFFLLDEDAAGGRGPPPDLPLREEHRNAGQHLAPGHPLHLQMNLPIAVWMMQSFLAEVPVAVIEVPRSTARNCRRSWPGS